jgi:hypothetical protein
MTERRWASRQVAYQVAELNRKLKGWARCSKPTGSWTTTYGTGFVDG